MAATMHVLFHWETPGEIPTTISNEALKAAQNFVELCTQHAAFLAGRGNIPEEIDSLTDKGLLLIFLGRPITITVKVSGLHSCRFI